MYGHPTMVQEHAGAFAPRVFSVTVTEMQQVIRACRIRSAMVGSGLLMPAFSRDLRSLKITGTFERVS